MKKILLLYSRKTPTLDSALKQLEGFNVICSEKLPDNTDEYDIIAGINFDGNFKGIACRHSLLPAFESDEPVKEAFEAGVKVTGITIYQTDPFKIITQYPLIITNDSHYDDVKKQLEYLEQVIYPLVLEKLAKNEAFDIQKLLKNETCSGNCSSCSGCGNQKIEVKE